jgi:hypothetical protein
MHLWELLVSQKFKCALSGVDIVSPPKSAAGPRVHNSASLDRIDSSKGYIYGNLQWIHKDINTTKMKMPNDIFINWCHTISNYQKSII